MEAIISLRFGNDHLIRRHQHIMVANPSLISSLRRIIQHPTIGNKTLGSIIHYDVTTFFQDTSLVLEEGFIVPHVCTTPFVSLVTSACILGLNSDDVIGV